MNNMYDAKGLIFVALSKGKTMYFTKVHIFRR